MSTAMVLGVVYWVSELGLTVFKRSGAGEARRVDRGSLSLLWAAIVVSVLVAYALPPNAPSWDMMPAKTFIDAGIALFVAGLALRWYSIVYLGRFFTVDVAIASDHRVIDTGPYRYIRHPSYTGALMVFVGLGFCLCNWASLVVIFVPTLGVFLWRMRIEEAALSGALGDNYRDYMRRTKRLIPAFY